MLRPDSPLTVILTQPAMTWPKSTIVLPLGEVEIAIGSNLLDAADWRSDRSLQCVEIPLEDLSLLPVLSSNPGCSTRWLKTGIVGFAVVDSVDPYAARSDWNWVSVPMMSVWSSYSRWSCANSAGRSEYRWRR